MLVSKVSAVAAVLMVGALAGGCAVAAPQEGEKVGQTQDDLAFRFGPIVRRPRPALPACTAGTPYLTGTCDAGLDIGYFAVTADGTCPAISGSGGFWSPVTGADFDNAVYDFYYVADGAPASFGDTQFVSFLSLYAPDVPYATQGFCFYQWITRFGSDVAPDTAALCASTLGVEQACDGVEITRLAGQMCNPELNPTLKGCGHLEASGGGCMGCASSNPGPYSKKKGSF